METGIHKVFEDIERMKEASSSFKALEVLERKMDTFKRSLGIADTVREMNAWR